MSDESAWSSTHPDVLAWWARVDDEHKDYSAACDQLALGYPDHKLVVNNGRHHRCAIGLQGSTSPGPLWREKDWFYVPRKNSADGKALAKRFAEVKWTVPVVPGLPDGVWLPGAKMFQQIIRYPSVTMIDGVVWANFDVSAEIVRQGGENSAVNMGGTVDDEMWVERKMSEYHLAIESREASA